MFHYEAKYYETIKMRQNSGGNNMKMVKHMALPFVTICALVSVTVMAYEANYAGNPVTVTNGWDSRQYIATSILRIDSDSVGANVGAGIEVVAKDKNTILKSYIRAEPRLYLDGELWLAEGWHYSDGTQNGLYTESSTYFISRWGEVFAQSEFGTYKGSRGYEDYTAPATAKINLGNIKGNLSATENNKVRVNSNGQTYGSGWVDDTPELIAAVGAGGVKGYVYNADLLSLGDKATPDDETPEIPNSIHLYAKDGTTIIGEFLIGQING